MLDAGSSIEAISGGAGATVDSHALSYDANNNINNDSVTVRTHDPTGHPRCGVPLLR